jgi:NADH dehydrogenase/NADH:ubiquinone oxidoreductase 75 kD subunit (chain G)
MDKNTFTLNGKMVGFDPGQTILEAAEANGVFIPTLCYMKGVAPAGVCRICVVEVKGGNLVASCSTPVVGGMAVETGTEKVNKARRLFQIAVSMHQSERVL